MKVPLNSSTQCDPQTEKLATIQHNKQHCRKVLLVSFSWSPDVGYNPPDVGYNLNTVLKTRHVTRHVSKRQAIVTLACVFVHSTTGERKKRLPVVTTCTQ